MKAMTAITLMPLRKPGLLSRRDSKMNHSTNMRSRIYCVANIAAVDNVIWRGAAVNVNDAEEKAARETGQIREDLLGWLANEEF